MFCRHVQKFCDGNGKWTAICPMCEKEWKGIQQGEIVLWSRVMKEEQENKPQDNKWAISEVIKRMTNKWADGKMSDENFSSFIITIGVDIADNK